MASNLKWKSGDIYRTRDNRYVYIRAHEKTVVLGSLVKEPDDIRVKEMRKKDFWDNLGNHRQFSDLDLVALVASSDYDNYGDAIRGEK